MRRMIWLLVIATLGVAGCKKDGAAPAGSGEESKAVKTDPPKQDSPEVAALKAKIAQFAPAELTTDVSTLTESEKKAMAKIIEACKLMDPIFDRQVMEDYAEVRAKLAEDTSELGRLKLEYFDIMRGPWDRQDHHAPFATETPRDPGAGFYRGVDKDDFTAYLKAHPEERAALEGLFTLVWAKKDGGYVAQPYSEAYKQWLEPAAKGLLEAAEITENPSLAKFLRSRAAAFGTDDYYPSDMDWMDLDSRVEVTVGPYETYEDELMGLKAAFECFVTVSDPEESKKLAKYKALLPKMEDHLPVPDEVKTKRGSESPIRVVDVVYTSGDARKSVQTIAFNLPNDERVRKAKGAKKVMLRNIIETKFDLILRPIAAEILDPAQMGELSAKAFFNETLFHELSHSLGPAFTERDGEKVEVRLALENTYSPIEECKADVMGAYDILFLIDEGHFEEDFRNKLLVSYFIGLFRSVRFGVGEAHGKGAAVQINRFLEAGAATFDEAAGRFTVHPDRLEAAITALVKDLVMLQHEGDKAAAEALLAKHGKLTPPIEEALAKVKAIPVDIRPQYPLAE